MVFVRNNDPLPAPVALVTCHLAPCSSFSHSPVRPFEQPGRCPAKQDMSWIRDVLQNFPPWKAIEPPTPVTFWPGPTKFSHTRAQPATGSPFSSIPPLPQSFVRPTLPTFEDIPGINELTPKSFSKRNLINYSCHPTKGEKKGKQSKQANLKQKDFSFLKSMTFSYFYILFPYFFIFLPFSKRSTTRRSVASASKSVRLERSASLTCRERSSRASEGVSGVSGAVFESSFLGKSFWPFGIGFYWWIF